MKGEPESTHEKMQKRLCEKCLKVNKPKRMGEKEYQTLHISQKPFLSLKSSDQYLRDLLH